MEIELLISAVDADSMPLIKKMNVTSNAVLINQCGKEDTDVFPTGNGSVRVFCFDEKGVGKSRNRAIEYAKGDILLFSDDDIVYNVDYEKVILEEFANHKEADVLLFNVEVCEARRTYWNEDYKRVHIWNAGRYPAYSIAIRKEALDKSKVKYSTLFGGGAKYSCGEDSLFIKDCLDAGLRLFRTPAVIGKEEPRDKGESTWFNGYNEKFFFDRGVLYKQLYGNLATLMGFRFVYTKRAVMCNDIPWKDAFKILKRGIKEEV